MKRILAVAAVVVLAAIVALWMMFQRIPEWYAPPEIAPHEIQAVKNDFAQTEVDLSKRLNAAEADDSFEFRLTQDQINAWLAVRGEIWPLSRKWLPPYLEQPMVVLDRDGIRVAALLTHQSLRAVVSLRVEVRAEPDGLFVRLAEVAAGNLPIPRSQVRKFLKRLDRKFWPMGAHLPGQIGPHRLPSLGNILEGIRLPNTWIWMNGKQPFRITSIDLEPGQVRIGIEPLPRSTLQEGAHQSRR